MDDDERRRRRAEIQDRLDRSRAELLRATFPLATAVEWVAAGDTLTREQAQRLARDFERAYDRWKTTGIEGDEFLAEVRLGE